MKNEHKKPYVKPKIGKIKLDAKCAVLGFCKSTGKVGPGVPGCSPGVPCSSAGS